MLRFLKKTIGVCFIGFGVGMLLVLLLPTKWWLFIVGIVIAVVGTAWLACG